MPQAKLQKRIWLCQALARLLRKQASKQASKINKYLHRVFFTESGFALGGRC
jgi:hypothetical protein